MLLKKLSKIIYIKGTYSEQTPVTVKLYGTDAILWTGPAKDLKKYAKTHKGWFVIEVRIDNTDILTNVDYNKGKIIIVK